MATPPPPNPPNPPGPQLQPLLPPPAQPPPGDAAADEPNAGAAAATQPPHVVEDDEENATQQRKMCTLPQFSDRANLNMRFYHSYSTTQYLPRPSGPSKDSSRSSRSRTADATTAPTPQATGEPRAHGEPIITRGLRFPSPPIALPAAPTLSRNAKGELLLGPFLDDDDALAAVAAAEPSARKFAVRALATIGT
jgi:hypothetical protein